MWTLQTRGDEIRSCSQRAFTRFFLYWTLRRHRVVQKTPFLRFPPLFIYLLATKDFGLRGSSINFIDIALRGALGLV